MAARDEESSSAGRGWKVVAPAAVAAALLIGVVAVGLSRPAAVVVAPGEQAPEFELPHLSEEGTLSSDSLRGKIVVLNFWASYCPPCRDEVPVLARAAKEYEDRGVVVIGVDVRRDSAGNARDFADHFGMTYPAVRDEEGVLAQQLDVNDRYLPQTFFIDEQSRFARIQTGGLTTQQGAAFLGALGWEELTRQLDAMVGA